MKVTVHCPSCGWEGQANAEDLGGTAECPTCKKDFVLEQQPTTPRGASSPRVRTQAEFNPRVALSDIPKRVREVLWDDEVPLYAARPAHSALVLSMILSGIFWSIVGLSLFVVGIVLTLPLALLITYYSWKNRYYIITSERTIVSQGIFNVAIKILSSIAIFSWFRSTPVSLTAGSVSTPSRSQLPRRAVQVALCPASLAWQEVLSR